jgi:hypothetical protein
LARSALERPWNLCGASQFAWVQPGDLREALMITISHLQPIVSLLAGILILIIPHLLNYIVAIYLILVGIIGLGILR